MTAEKLELYAAKLSESVGDWEQDVLRQIGKRVNQISKMTVAEVKQLNNIATVKKDIATLTKDLARITGRNVAEVEKMYSDFLEWTHLESNPLYDYRNLKFLPLEENKRLQTIVKAFAKSTGGEMLNLSQTNGLFLFDAAGQIKTIQKAYQSILDKAVMQVTSGATDFHSAMRNSLERLGGAGVRVSYESGITRRLDTVVRQAMMWGSKQMYNEYASMIGEEIGADGIEIDYHSFPRPSHAFMQGKQYSLTGARVVDGVYFPSADEPLERLQDYNCYHYAKNIICGVSEPTHSAEELKKLDAQNNQKFDLDGKKFSGYEITQKMRALETAIREEKGKRTICKASGDKTGAKKAEERSRAFMKKLQDIQVQTGIRIDHNRT